MRIVFFKFSSSLWFVVVSTIHVMHLAYYALQMNGCCVIPNMLK